MWNNQKIPEGGVWKRLINERKICKWTRILNIL